MKRSVALSLALVMSACTTGELLPERDAEAPLDAAFDAPPDEPDAGPTDAGPPPDRALDPDAACASSVARATLETLPVDIIWIIDNSASMQPAIDQVQAGLNDFAALIEARELDYRVLLLGLRGDGAVEGTNLYAICIPPPLAGDDSCGDGPRFAQIEVNIHSTQPLEQFLGTLGQTAGYRGGSHGSVPWAHRLRPEASKSIVVISDDNARMADHSEGSFVAGSDPVATADFFETYHGGANLYANSRDLPQGILHARWEGLFDGYLFNAIYGYGSDTDPAVRCTFDDGSRPDSSGPTYTELVARTGGARAMLCDGAAAWAPFISEVATAVERSTRIDCATPIPEPPDGSFVLPNLINVWIDLGDGAERVGAVAGPDDCRAGAGWYYDDPADPTTVILCGGTCAELQSAPSEDRNVEVQFGCATIPA